MTREKIIKSMSLQDAIQVFKDTNCYGTMDIAKSVILKALEQKPCEDAIPRSTAITLINDVQSNGGFSCYADYEYLYDHLSTMPSINPQKNIVNNGTMNITL